MADKQSFEFSGSLEVRAVADYLEALARGLREGKVALESGEQAANLDVGPIIALELKADANPEKNRYAVAIDLGWRLAQPSTPPSLTIGNSLNTPNFET